MITYVAFAIAALFLAFNLVQDDLIGVIAWGLMMLAWAVMAVATEIAARSGSTRRSTHETSSH